MYDQFQLLIVIILFPPIAIVIMYSAFGAKPIVRFPGLNAKHFNFTIHN